MGGFRDAERYPSLRYDAGDVVQ